VTDGQRDRQTDRIANIARDSALLWHASVSSFVHCFRCYPRLVGYWWPAILFWSAPRCGSVGPCMVCLQTVRSQNAPIYLDKGKIF